PSGLTWSPDGTQIAFTAHVQGEESQLATAPAKPEGAEWAPPVTVIESLHYRSDGRGYLEPGNTHVFVIPAEGGTLRQLTSGDFNHGSSLAWSPDGQMLVVSSNREEDWEFNRRNTELWSIDVDTGAMRQLTKRFGPDNSATFSPDGSKLAYLGYDDKKMGYHNVNANRLYIQYDDHGKRHLATLSMSGEVSSFIDDIGSAGVSRPYTTGEFSVADNGAYAYTMGAPNRPADVAAGRRGRAPSRLTHLNDDLLARKTLGVVEEITWRGMDR
ncbi:MAG: DPP IV N-terminal domain-containing protein, partial [Woeseiales bacterium]